jgi:hypothetical protein
LKYRAEVIAEPLQKVISQIWKTENIPTDWKKEIIEEREKKEIEKKDRK